MDSNDEFGLLESKKFYKVATTDNGGAGTPDQAVTSTGGDTVNRRRRYVSQRAVRDRPAAYEALLA